MEFGENDPLWLIKNEIVNSRNRYMEIIKNMEERKRYLLNEINQIQNVDLKHDISQKFNTEYSNLIDEFLADKGEIIRLANLDAQKMENSFLQIESSEIEEFNRIKDTISAELCVIEDSMAELKAASINSTEKKIRTMNHQIADSKQKEGEILEKIKKIKAFIQRKKVIYKKKTIQPNSTNNTLSQNKSYEEREERAAKLNQTLIQNIKHQIKKELKRKDSIALSIEQIQNQRTNEKEYVCRSLLEIGNEDDRIPTSVIPSLDKKIEFYELHIEDLKMRIEFAKSNTNF